jgi:hypothetical protein
MTQITIRTRETITIATRSDSFKAWCEHCGDVVIALTPSSLLGALHLPPTTLQSMLESRKWHVIEVGAPAPLICCSSLSTGTENEILIEGEGK